MTKRNLNAVIFLIALVFFFLFKGGGEGGSQKNTMRGEKAMGKNRNVEGSYNFQITPLQIPLAPHTP